MLKQTSMAWEKHFPSPFLQPAYTKIYVPWHPSLLLCSASMKNMLWRHEGRRGGWEKSEEKLLLLKRQAWRHLSLKSTVHWQLEKLAVAGGA